MKVINFLNRVATYISFAAVCIILMLTVADVFMRYVFSKPVTGTTELTEFLMALLVLGIVPAALENKHVTVDILMERLTPKGKALFDAITILIGSILVIIIGLRSWAIGSFMINNDVRSPTLDVPIFPFYIIVAFGFILLFITMIAIVINKFKEVFKA